MIADDRIDEMARECAFAVRLSGDPQRLMSASMHLLFRSGATLTRAIGFAERARKADGYIGDVPSLATARQRIMTEMRRRT